MIRKIHLFATAVLLSCPLPGRAGETAAEVILGGAKCSSSFKVLELERLQLVAQQRGDVDSIKGVTSSISEMHSCEDAAFLKAAEVAKPYPAILEAVKTMHLKNSAFITSLSSAPAERRAADRERSEARERVIMEMRLAGIN